MTTTRCVFDLKDDDILLVHRRHRLGHRPQLRRLRPAGQRRDGRHVRRRAEFPRRRSLLGRSSRGTRSPSSTPRRPRSAPSSSGATQWSNKHDLSSLRLLGTVGEPINPEAWMWYHEVIGGERCPIVDTWWQTETGGIMITPLPGATATKPGIRDAPVLRRRCRRRRRARQRQSAPTRAACSSSASPGPPCCAASSATPSAIKSNIGARSAECYFTGDGARRDAGRLLLDHGPRR